VVLAVLFHFEVGLQQVLFFVGWFFSGYGEYLPFEVGDDFVSFETG